MYLFLLIYYKLINQKGFYNLNIIKDQNLILNFNNNLMKIILILKKINKELILNFTNNNGNFIHEIENDRSISFICFEGNISFTFETEINIWVIPNNLCLNSGIVYNTDHVIADTFATLKDIESFCIFYEPIDISIHYIFELNDKISKPTFNLYSNLSLQNSNFDNICSGFKCHQDISYPFFIQINNFKKSTTLKFDFNLKNIKKDNEICERFDIITLNNDEILLDSFPFSHSDIDCTSSLQSHDFDGMIQIIILVPIIILFLYLIYFISQKICKDEPYHEMKDENNNKNINKNKFNEDEKLVHDNENLDINSLSDE